MFQKWKILRMKKIIWFFCFLFLANPIVAAEDENCEKLPSCEELGYTMSVSDCEGKSTLRCPFEPDNDNTVYCSGEE